MQVVNAKGKPALPGGLQSGVCGTAILDLAVKAVANLATAKKELRLKHIKVIGCGGVTDADGFRRHLNAGAEFVMCATAALFNPGLPLEVAKYIKDQKLKQTI